MSFGIRLKTISNDYAHVLIVPVGGREVSKSSQPATPFRDNGAATVKP